MRAEPIRGDGPVIAAGLRLKVERSRRWISERRLLDTLRAVGLPLVLIGGACAFGVIAHGHYPVRDWLFFRYAKAWALALYWFAGCMSAGYALVRRCSPRLAVSEQLVLAASSGVYLSYLVLFAGGVLGLYRYAAFAVLFPAVLLSTGARSSIRLLRRLVRHFGFGPRRARSAEKLPAWLMHRAVLAFGIICLAMLYLNILTPDNASFDAIYYHMGLAEQYKVRGGIMPSPEGWLVEALPLLASTLYAWAFIFPGNDLFDAMMVCAHLEYVLFLATVACLPVVVRTLVPRARSASAWVALFLFPGIIAYDAGLHSGSDHIAAFWALPLWLAAWRSWRRLEPGLMALFSIAAAGALMTKYQCVSLVLGPAVALLGRALWLGVRRSSIAWGRGLMMALAVGVVITTPHWLKNWVWFGDPLFPALHRYLDVHPWFPGAGEIVEWNYRRLIPRPEGAWHEKIVEIVRGSFEYAYRPLTGFHRDWPIFGPLFTLSLTWLVFLRRAGRLWLLAAATQGGIFFWYFFAYYERYLQPLVPWMAAVVAGSIVLIARRGWVARAALAGVLGLALVWGGDVYFFPHFLLKEAPVRTTALLLGSGFRGDIASRQLFRSPEKELGESLPPDARLLLHEHHVRLGLARPIVTDYTGFQTRFSYQDMASARDVYELYRELGVTHLIWERQKSSRVDSIAGDLRFFQFATQFAVRHQRFGILMIAELPPEPPPAPARQPEQVAYLGCDRAYEPGMYPLALLNTHPNDGRHVSPPVVAPERAEDLVAFTRNADFLVTGPSCKGKRWPIPKQVFAPFDKMATRRTEELWVRRRGEPG
jgi:hypothetical protein